MLKGPGKRGNFSLQTTAVKRGKVTTAVLTFYILRPPPAPPSLPLGKSSFTTLTSPENNTGDRIHAGIKTHRQRQKFKTWVVAKIGLVPKVRKVNE